jgi:DNA-binding PadR family transcriptional regulator
MIEHLFDNDFLIISTIHPKKPICITRIRVNIEEEFLKIGYIYQIPPATARGAISRLTGQGFVESKSYRCPESGRARLCYQRTEKGSTAIRQTLALKQRFRGYRGRSSSMTISMGNNFCPSKLAILLALSNGAKSVSDLQNFIEESSYDEFPQILYWRELRKLVLLELVSKSEVNYQSHTFEYQITDNGQDVIVDHKNITDTILTIFFQNQEESSLSELYPKDY